MTNKRTLIRGGTILTMDPAGRVLRHGGVVTAGQRIERVIDEKSMAGLQGFDGEVVDAREMVVLPGFIQTHLHLCQTLFRGLADGLDLLEWLRLKIFPLEAAHSASSMRASVRLGLAELIRSGTTTVLDMGSVFHQEEIVAAAEESGIRAFLGKAMMDLNDLAPGFREDTSAALDITLRQAERWHGYAGDRVRYAVAPRFVLSCTDELLREAMAMTRCFPGMLFHTHASEQRREEEAVRKRCGTTTIPFLEQLGVLQPVSCLAHCVWVTDADIGLIRKRNAKVLHCPSSNLKLGSGVARVPELLDAGVAVSLGADGAPCNNTLDMFHEMRLAALVQTPAYGPSAMDAHTVFSLATIGGATALGLEKETGSIEEGKKADIILLDMNRAWNPTHGNEGEHMYSSIVYTGRPENVRYVMIDGTWALRGGELQAMDAAAVLDEARAELRLLLKRAHL